MVDYSDEEKSSSLWITMAEPRKRAVALIKSVHILAGIVLTGGLVVLLYEVIVDRITILTAIAVALFLIEGVVLIANDWKCPLTSYAERLGSTHGQVTDILLPKWFADRFFRIFGALWAVVLLLLAIRILDSKGQKSDRPTTPDGRAIRRRIRRPPDKRSTARRLGTR